MLSLCGKENTMADLKNVKMERPQGAGKFWKGIQHTELLDTMQTAFDKRGWAYDEPKFTLQNDGARMAGAFDLNIPELPAMDDQSYSLGFLTANDRSRSLRMSVGTTVFVCNNGMLTGDIVMQKRHTLHVSLVDEVDAALTAYSEKAAEIPKFVESLKETAIGQEGADHLLMEAGRNYVIGWKTLGEVSKEFQNPTFTDNAGESLWALYNAFTYNIKSAKADRQFLLMTLFKNMLVNYMQK